MKSFLSIVEREWWILVLTIGLSLIPLLWFKGDYLITGTDIDFSPYPQERFFTRSYTWYSRILAGTDRSNNTASLPYIGTSALLSSIGLDIITVEKLTFVIWFLMTGLAMYFLTSVILSEEEGEWVPIAKLISILIYMVNYYNVFIWVRLQLALSNLILFPVFFGLLIGATQKNFKLAPSLFLLAIASFVCGPSGIQPPLLYVMFLAFGLYSIFYSLYKLKGKKLRYVFRAFACLFLFSIVFFLSSGYWSFPLLSFIFSSGYTDSGYGAEVYSVEGLLGWTSSVSSFLNVFRFFGDSVWYSGWGGQPYAPEFSAYKENVFLIFLGFVLPLVSFLPILSKKFRDKFLIGFFSFLTLVGLFFSKGTHAPFGSIFMWLVRNFPLFWIHRAPWQKFTLITVLGYSVLGGLGFGLIYLWLKKRWELLREVRISSIAYSLIIIFLILNFNYVFVKGDMFPEGGVGDFGYHQVNNLGFHHKIPSYIEEARTFINSQNENFKIFLLPEDKTTVYDWGYAGATDIVSVVLNRTALSTQYGEGFSPPQSLEGIYSSIIDFLYSGQEKGILEVLGFFNIKYILQRNDFRYDFFGDFDSPGFISRILAGQGFVFPINHIGAWDFYEIPNENIYPLIYAPITKIFYRASSSDLIHILLHSPEVEEPLAFYSGSLPDFIVVNPEPGFTKLENMDWHSGWAWPEANVNPESALYILTRMKEKQRKYFAGSLYEKIDVYSWIAVKRIEELFTYDDLSEGMKTSLVREYAKDMRIALGLLKDVSPEERDSKYWNYAGKQILYMERVMRELFKRVEYLDFTEVADVYNEFLDWYKTESLAVCLNHCYKVEIPLAGNYQLIIPRGFFSDRLQESSYKLSISEFGNPVVIITRESSVSDPVEISLKEGTYVFDISFTQLSEQETPQLRKIDIYKDKNLLVYVPEVQKILKGYDIEEVYSMEVAPWDSYKDYTVNFDYYINSGANARLAFIEKSTEDQYSIRMHNALDANPSGVRGVDFVEQRDCSYINDDLCYKKFSMKVRSSPNSESAYLYIFTYSPEFQLNQGQDELLIQNFSVSERLAPKILLNRQAEINSTYVPKVSYKKLNPTKYILKVEGSDGPFDLVFNESFHNGWRLYLDKEEHYSLEEDPARNYFERVREYPGESYALDSMPLATMLMEQIASESHKVANGYANSWSIDPGDVYGRTDFTLVMEFNPQRIFYLGLLTSIITLVGTGLGFLFFYVKKSKKEN